MRVPNISLLGLNVENLQAVYDASFDDRKVLKVRKTCRVQTAKTDTTAACSQPPGVLDHINWHAAWSEYVRGNVVSQAASGLIKSFLLHTLAASGAVHGDHESGSDGHESEPDPDVPPLHLREDHLQQLIIPPAPEDFEPPDASETGLTASKKFQRASQKTMRTLEYNRSIRTAFAVWGTERSQQKVADKKFPGHMYADSLDEFIAAKRQLKKDKDLCTAPFNAKRNAAGIWHRPAGEQWIDKVLADISNEEAAPNAQQLSFLQSFAQRLKLELLENLQNSIGASLQEPMLDCIQGYPGTGAWIVQLLNMFNIVSIVVISCMSLRCISEDLYKDAYKPLDKTV